MYVCMYVCIYIYIYICGARRAAAAQERLRAWGIPRIPPEELFRHRSIRRIAKQLNTTQTNLRGTRYLIRRMDKPYP